MLLERVQI